MTLKDLAKTIAEEANLKYSNIEVDDEMESNVALAIDVPYDSLPFDVNDEQAADSFCNSIERKFKDQYYPIQDAYGISGSGEGISEDLVYKFFSSDISYDDKNKIFTLKLYFIEV